MIPEYELQDLFAEHRIFERIASRELVESLESKTSRAGRMCCVAGFSYFSRIRRRDGQEVARAHYLECVFGYVIARFASHIIVEGVLYRREGHQRRPAE